MPLITHLYISISHISNYVGWLNLAVFSVSIQKWLRYGVFSRVHITLSLMLHFLPLLWALKWPLLESEHQLFNDEEASNLIFNTTSCFKCWISAHMLKTQCSKSYLLLIQNMYFCSFCSFMFQLLLLLCTLCFLQHISKCYQKHF